MINSLFDRKQAKQFDTIAKEKAKLHKKELSAVEDFMSSNSMETIVKVLDVVDANGHPTEKAISLELREKYTNYTIIKLQSIYIEPIME